MLLYLIVFLIIFFTLLTLFIHFIYFILARVIMENWERDMGIRHYQTGL